MYSIHFVDPYIHNVFCFVFLIVMTIVCPQTSLFLMCSEEGGSLEEVKLLHVTSDVLV